MHAMVDLETLGTEPGSAIISIGAVSFRREDAPGTFVDRFYETISIKSNLDAGLRINPKTIEWWIGQDAGARNRLTFEKDLFKVLDQFTIWYGRAGIVNVWGNGASFDLVLMEAAYRAANYQEPWMFYNHRCFRTMKMEYPGVPAVKPKVAHDALEDAKAQAEWLQRIWHTIDGKAWEGQPGTLDELIEPAPPVPKVDIRLL